MVEMFPVTIFGLSNPHTTSTDLGRGMFSLEILYFSSLTAMAAPPPLFVTRGVEIYFRPSSCNIFSNSNLCFLLCFFSHTSERSASDISRSNISFLKLFIFGISERKLDTEMTGSVLHTDSLSFLLTVCLTGLISPGRLCCTSYHGGQSHFLG